MCAAKGDILDNEKKMHVAVHQNFKTKYEWKTFEFESVCVVWASCSSFVSFVQKYSFVYCSKFFYINYN